MKKVRIEKYALPQNTMSYIASKVRQTSMNVGLSYTEEEDLKQHLYLCAICARDNFDKNREASLETYLHMEVDAKTKNFLRDRKAGKRVNIVLTLDEPIVGGSSEDGDEDETWLDRVADENDHRQEESDLRHDVAYALSQIKDERTRTICKLIMQGVTYVDIAKIVGIPEWSIRQQILPALAPLFKKSLNS